MTSYKHLTLSELLTYAQSDWTTPLEKALLDACLEFQDALRGGADDSYDQGYEDGKEEGYHDGYDEGYETGYDVGKSSHEQE